MSQNRQALLGGDFLFKLIKGAVKKFIYFRIISMTPIRYLAACVGNEILLRNEAGHGLRLAWFSIVMLVSGVMYGCHAEQPKLGEQPVKIGVILPINGNDSAVGADLKSGVELALEIVNQKFDLPLPLAPEEGLARHGGIKLKAIYRDSNSDPVVAAKAVENLCLHEKVNVLMGGYTCAESLAISEQAEIFQIPFMDSLSTAPRLTQKGLQWFFRLTPDDNVFVDNFFQFLNSIQLNHPQAVRRRLVLVFENGPWGTGVVQVTRKLAKKYGYEIIAEIAYDGKKASLERIIENHRHSFQPQSVIVQASNPKETLALLEAYSSLNIQPGAILAMQVGLFSPAFIKTLGPQPYLFLGAAVWPLDTATPNPLALQVNNLYKQRYGRDLNDISARSFTGAFVMAEALNRASTLTPRAIRAALLKTDIPKEHLILPWQGIQFEPHSGQNILGNGIIVQIQQGAPKTIWPEGIAKSRVILPFLPIQVPELQP
jgi:branched-chain amino acid transport system substrate-binding protein